MYFRGFRIGDVAGIAEVEKEETSHQAVWRFGVPVAIGHAMRTIRTLSDRAERINIGEIGGDAKSRQSICTHLRNGVFERAGRGLYWRHGWGGVCAIETEPSFVNSVDPGTARCSRRRRIEFTELGSDRRSPFPQARE